MTKIIELIILIILFLSPFSTLKSQELKRRAMLGIRMANVNDSIAKANNLKETSGVLIHTTVPNATFDKAGIKPGAILLEINEQKVNEMVDIGPLIPNLRDGDPISFTYIQNGKKEKVKTKAIGRPKELVNNSDIIFGQVKVGENRLRSILVKPKGELKSPVVYFIQGYTCASTEFSLVPDITTLKLIQDWVNAGYAVYRIEKAGIGDSEGEKHCMEMDFNEEYEIFKAGYSDLAKNPNINSEEIFLFGHSMGGVVAPLLAKEFQPKGVITYGTLIHTWFEYMQELTRVQGEMFKTPYKEVEADIRRVTPFWFDYYIKGQTKEEILANEDHFNMLKEEGTLENFKNGIFMDRHYTFWQKLQQVSLVNTWLEVKSNVLALYGEFDIQALNANHIKSIANIVNTNNPGKGSWQIIGKADHGFVNFNSMEENVQTLNSGGYFQALQKKYNPNIAKATIEWMNAL